MPRLSKSAREALEYDLVTPDSPVRVLTFTVQVAENSAQHNLVINVLNILDAFNSKPARWTVRGQLVGLAKLCLRLADSEEKE